MKEWNSLAWMIINSLIDSYLDSMQIAKLQDDNKALDRLTKSKEAALLEAERTVQVALAKASMVDDLQNKNQELMKQIEICQVNAILHDVLFPHAC